MDEIEKLKLNDEFNAWYNAEKVEEKCRNSAYSEGVDNGIIVGKTETKLEIAKNLLALNIDKNTIINATGLSLNELEDISNNSSIL